MSLEIARAKILLNAEEFRSDFFEWLSANWHVFEYFEKSANQVHDHGFKHYSARTIVEVMRHRSKIREIGDGEWKLNDHRTPDMARLYMMLHPENSDFFEFRERKAKCGSNGSLSA